MQDKKTMNSATLGVTPEDRLIIRMLREDLRAAQKSAEGMWDILQALHVGRPERHPLAAAANNAYMAATELRRTLELVQAQEARWEGDQTTALIRVPLGIRGRKEGKS